METAGTVLDIVSVYGWIGLGVGVVFLFLGIDRVDENARGAYVFRPLLLPGVVLIWPIVLWRWGTLEIGADSWRHRHLPERRMHGPIWYVLALGIPLIVIVALGLQQTWPDGAAPVRLEAAQ